MGSEVSSEQNSQEEDFSIALYNKVCTFQRENAEKITGMLLELPQEELKTLLCDDSKLMAKIYEAIKALDNESKDKQRKLIGDVMYCEVEKAYIDQEIAGKITGMLLEMELENLEQLVLNKKALLVKIHEAYAVLKTYNDANNRLVLSFFNVLLMTCHLLPPPYPPTFPPPSHLRPTCFPPPHLHPLALPHPIFTSLALPHPIFTPLAFSHPIFTSLAFPHLIFTPLAIPHPIFTPLTLPTLLTPLE